MMRTLDRFDEDGHIYRQDLRDMQDKEAEFNQSFKNTYEPLLVFGKIEMGHFGH